MVHAAVRTIVLNPQPGVASTEGGVTYSAWLVGSVLPMWMMSRAVVLSWRAMWRLGGRRRRQARRELSPAAA
jgi:hypothetical protein